jgi:hypothetical protein
VCNLSPNCVAGAPADAYLRNTGGDAPIRFDGRDLLIAHLVGRFTARRTPASPSLGGPQQE